MIYSKEFRLKMAAANIRNMINSGFGRTNKPLSSRRLKELKLKLEEIEKELNDLKEDKI